MLLLLFVCIAVALRTEAQETISGVVSNSYDSSKIAFAKVSVAGEKAQIATDANGQFSLPANTTSGTLQIRVSALGIDSVFNFRAPFPKLFSLWVVPKGFEIGTTVIRGLSAKEVVKEAMKRIPQNYPTDGYLYYGFYRQYYRKDSAFQNLIEARVATLVRPKIISRKLKLEAEYRFLPLAIQRQPYKKMPIEGLDESDGIVEELFGVDPIYFQDEGPFIPTVFNGTIFRFDTTNKDQNNYVIQYKSNSSSENHGLMYQRGKFQGESHATGKITIDRKSFAFIHIERKTFRNKWYDYPKQNNIIFPGMFHYIEFLEGHLDIWYKRHEDRWILARLRHGFTNEFLRTNRLGFGRECALGQYYEWKTDSVSRYVSREMLPLFYKSPMLHFVEMPADTLDTHTTPPFFFHPKRKVYEAAGW